MTDVMDVNDEEVTLVVISGGGPMAFVGPRATAERCVAQFRAFLRGNRMEGQGYILADGSMETTINFAQVFAMQLREPR